MPAAPQLPQYVALAVVFAGIDFVVMLAYALTGVRISAFFIYFIYCS